MRCCVPCCTNDTKNTMKSNRLTFHRFPKELTLRHLWLEVLGLIGWEPDECSAVCSEHFQKDAFYETESGTRRVKSDAVPVSDIEIFSILDIKEEGMEVDGDNIIIKQELFNEEEIAESSESICATAILNDKTESFQTKEIKQDLNEEETDCVSQIQMKQKCPGDEIAESSKPKCSKETPDDTEISPVNDPSDNEIEKQKEDSKESLVTSEKTVIKQDLNKENKERVSKIQIKHKCPSDEIAESSKPKCSKVTPDYTEISPVNDPSGNAIEKQEQASKESPVTREREEEQPEKTSHRSLRKSKKIVQRRDKHFTCHFCDYRCSLKHVLLRHIKKHKGEKAFACQLCDYRCIQKSYLTTHMRTHTRDKAYACDICDYRCVRKCNLVRHIQTHTGEKPFACEICTYRCFRKSHLDLHTKTHTGERPFACDICEYKCIQQTTLAVHMGTHKKKKPFSCTICDYRCKEKGHLTRHMKTHTGNKSYACEICDFRCYRKYSLTRHNMEIHNGEKTFACQLCKYKSNRQSSLTGHMSTHAKKKPFVCKICNYGCKVKASYIAHMRTHEMEKSFVCQICDYRCVRESSYIRHLMSHTGEKPFACKICDFKTARSCTLIRHMSRHTREK